MATLPNHPLTEEQYLAIEREAFEKSEFHDGQMFAMSGSTPGHAFLSNRIGALLDRQIPPGCRTFSSDLRIKATKAGLFTYADCAVICGELEYFGDRQDVVLNPMLIVEVLSPSTEDYDRGKKFESYRTIASFCEYLIIHQDQRHIEHHSKQDDGSWLLREYTGENGVIPIPRLQATISMEELYASALDLDS